VENFAGTFFCAEKSIQKNIFASSRERYSSRDFLENFHERIFVMKWIFFIALPVAILGLNLFLAWVAWRLFSPRRKLQIAAAGTVVAALILFALSFVGFLVRAQDNAFFAFAWNFLAFAVVPMIYLALWALAGTIVVKIFPKLSRFKNGFAVAGVAVVALVCAHGLWKFEHPKTVYYLWNPATAEFFENTTGTTEKGVGVKLRIVATADWHLGERIDRSIAENFVRLVNAQNPELVAICGDLIDGRIEPCEAEKMDEVLREIRAPLGVFASLGNHEYFGNIPCDKAFIERANIRLLVDEAVNVDEKILLVGRDDATNRSRSTAENLLAVAREKSRLPALVLDHQPRDASALSATGADLVFCGHTHDGQLWPATWLVRLFHRYVSGAYVSDVGKPIFVTSGIGLWHIPYRVGCRSELVVIDVL